MNELIRITQNAAGEQVVSARELHAFLEVKTDFTDWCKRMFEYGFSENQDFKEVFLKNEVNLKGGRPSIDYALTLNCAKEICMIQRTDKGKQARLYFIECERRLKEATKPQLPADYLSALKALVVAEEERLVLQAESESQKRLLAEQKPKVEFYDAVADATGTFDMREVSALLKLPFGRNTLFARLREAEVLMPDNLPYRRYIDAGYFQVVETSWLNPKTDEINISKQTRITQKGLEWLSRNIENLVED